MFHIILVKNDISAKWVSWGVKFDTGICFDCQDERYQHLSAEEMSTVEKSANEAMGWMNSKLLAQSKLSITQDPAVKVAEIIQKIQVSGTVSAFKTNKKKDPSCHHGPSMILWTCIVTDRVSSMSSFSVGAGGDLRSCGEPTPTQSWGGSRR